VRDEEIVWTARHPRNNPAWPLVGMLAQRGKNRPNRLGVTVARLVSVSGRIRPSAGSTRWTDAGPRRQARHARVPAARRVRQPDWASELMRDYWVRAS
jgi:hypothetical protein